MNRFDSLPRDWNLRVFTSADFDNFCEQAGIRVWEVPLSAHGFYLTLRKIPIICVNKRLDPTTKLFVKFHELGHHWLHQPGRRYGRYKYGYRSEIDHEANVVAACALLPKRIVEMFSPEQIEEIFGYSQEMIKFRFELLRNEGI